MTISVITVCRNSEKEIEPTIRSLLAQDCLVGDARGDEAPVMVEYLLIDGASMDETLCVAERYRTALEEKGIRYRVYSEPDQGIYDAMNKGSRLATGDVIGFLNSGDTYESDTLRIVADTFRRTGCELMFGDIRICRANGTSFVKRARLRRFQTSRDWNHPTTFVRAELMRSYPFRCLGIHDDYGFYLRMRSQGRKIVTVDHTLAQFRMGGASNRKSLREAVRRIRDRYRYCYRINGYSRWYLAECIAIEAAKMLLG